MAVDGPALTTLEATPVKPKKNKKRKNEEVDVDDEEEAPSSKKVKLTKEEKKALKKAIKAKAKSEAAAIVSYSPCVSLQETYKVLINRIRSHRRRKRGKKGNIRIKRKRKTREIRKRRKRRVKSNVVPLVLTAFFASPSVLTISVSIFSSLQFAHGNGVHSYAMANAPKIQCHQDRWRSIWDSSKNLRRFYSCKVLTWDEP